VLGGIVMGLVAALLYQRFSRTKLSRLLGSSAAGRSCHPQRLRGVVIRHGLRPDLASGRRLVLPTSVSADRTGAWGAGIFGVVVRR